MSIFLIRHGETALNAARVVQPADTPLSERGQAQAEAVARRLASLGVDEILSSDLPRAWRTAETIAAHTGAPISAAPLLQERNFGAWRGRAYDSLTHDPINSVEAPPGGESMAEFEARAAEAWRLIVATDHATGGHLAVVSHGLMIRALLALAVAPERLPAHIGNTSLSILDRAAEPAGERGNDADGQPLRIATLVNCTNHLPDDRRDDPKALSGG